MSCNLGSINLYEFIENPFSNLAFFDLEGFKKAVRITIKALDDIIDENVTKLPSQLEEYKENAKNYRNLGLGVFGYANMLMALNIVYGSEESLMFTDKVFRNMFITAVETSSDIAVEKGSFPSYDERVWDSEIIKNHFTEQVIDELKKKGLRNCSLLSIAPTGSISSMMGRSGGIEPEFAISYTRRTDNLDESYKIYIKTLEDYFEQNIDKTTIPPVFVASEDIGWVERIETQSIIQNFIDTAISSTINLAEDTTKEEIEQLYLYAWQTGLKGITCFRSGCKKMGILLQDSKPEVINNLPTSSAYMNKERGEIIEASNNVIGRKRKLNTGCGSLHCTAFFDPETGDLMETYLSKGSTGGCNNFMVGLSRMISLSARAGVDLDTIIDQLNSTGTCPSYAVRRATKKDASKGACCPMAVGYAIKEMWEEVQEYIKDSCLVERMKEIDVLESYSEPIIAMGSLI